MNANQERWRMMIVNWFSWMEEQDQWARIKVIRPSKRTPEKRYELTHWRDKKVKSNKAVITFAEHETETLLPDFAKMCSWHMGDGALDRFDLWRDIPR